MRRNRLTDGVVVLAALAVHAIIRNIDVDLLDQGLVNESSDDGAPVLDAGSQNRLANGSPTLWVDGLESVSEDGFLVVAEQAVAGLDSLWRRLFARGAWESALVIQVPEISNRQSRDIW